MVKTGAERSEKYDAKYDPEALLLRWKALRNWSIEKFRAIAFKQYLVQYIANKLYEDYEIGYFDRGKMHDKIEKLIFKYDTLTEPQLKALREDWIREGLPEDIFDVIPDIIAEIKPLFEACVYPTSKLFSKITLDPVPYEIVFPEIEDYTEPITPFEQEETLYLLPERKELSILETKICAHNTVRAIIPLFTAPTLKYEVIPLTPFLNIAVSTHNVYNQSPTINIGVVKTP